MCGIVGIFDTRGAREIDPALVKRMNETQHHRGPDEGDVYTDPIELAHRGIEHDYGFPGLIESDAQLISDHNKKYNAWVCGGVLDGGQ